MKRLLLIFWLLTIYLISWSAHASMLSDFDSTVAKTKMFQTLKRLYPWARTESEAWDLHQKKLNLPPQLSRNLPPTTINPNIWRYATLNSLATELEPFANAVGAPKIEVSISTREDVNAYFSTRVPEDGGNFKITFTKGFINHPDLTPDVIRYIFCHEVGHGSGGYPYYSGPNAHFEMAAEGQADYFAASRCMNFLLKDQTEENRNAVALASADLKRVCTVTISLPGRPSITKIDPICVRTLKAAVIFFKDMFGSDIDVTSSSSTVVTYTNRGGYPSPSCRIETARYGSKCKKIPDDFFSRPGTSAQDDEETNELAMGDNETCWMKKGDTSSTPTYRPRCWFKQQLIRY